MDTRSSNAVGYTHFTGDVSAQVGSSHGVRLSGGSTGGIVEAIGDDTDISLTLRGKGAGAVTIGAASTILTLGTSGGQIRMGGSTAPFYGMIRFLDTAVATPNFATTNAMVMETTHAITGLSSATVNGSPYFVLANAVNNSTDCALVGAFIGSTADQVHCRWLKASTLTVAASTATVNFLIFRF